MQWSKYFYYDEASPSCLRWACDILIGFHKSHKLHTTGDVAGYINKADGYFKVMVDGKNYSVHRIIYEMLVGDPTGRIVDHYDRVKTNNLVSNLRLTTLTGNNRNVSKQARSKTEVTGVILWQSRSNLKWYYRVQWNDLNGKHCCKSFRIDVHGDTVAFQLACEYREKMIAELNEQGAGYSPTHGK